MINKITIQNFKGIKDKVEIDLKPITLLFGPNSAGKSTVLQAIHYMKEILERNNTDPGKTDLGGEAVDLGGFANLVHRKEGDPEDIYKTSPIVIGFEIEEDDWIVPEFPGDHKYREGKSLLQNEGYDPYYLEFTIEWDESIQKPIVKKYDVHIKGKFIGRIEMSGWNIDDEEKEYKETGRKLMFLRSEFYGKQPKFKITKLNQDHPNLRWEQESRDEDEKKPDSELINLIQGILHSANDFEKDNKLGLFVFYNDAAFPSHPISLTGIGVRDINSKDVNDDIEFNDDAILFSDQSESLELTLSQIFLTPIEMLKGTLQRFRYIGPLRTIPERLFEPERFFSKARWSDGLGAWDTVYKKFDSKQKNDKDFVSRVNKWMEKLNIGYSIQIKNYKEINEENPLRMGLDDNGRIFENGEDIRRAFDKIQTKSKIGFLEEKNQIEVFAKDIGVGVTQVFPIIVGAVDWNGSIFAIEQPELHIHPAIQQKLADMLISCSSEDRFILVETHSEHIMLRLLRRIEETTENELPVPEYALKHDEISVVYVEPTDDGVEMTELPIDETGEFTRNWPRGFFEERAEDLL